MACISRWNLPLRSYQSESSWRIIGGEKVSSDVSCWHSKSTQPKQVLPLQQGAREEKIKNIKCQYSTN